MSDVAIRGPAPADGVFRPLTIAIMLAVGILGFLGMMLIGAYAPDLGGGGNGSQAHALSKSVNGFSGIVQLAEETGRNPVVIRDEAALGSEDLLIVTLDSGYTPLGDILVTRQAKPTLIVMPKWEMTEDPDHRGWTRYTGLKPASNVEMTLAPGIPFLIERRRSEGRALVGAAYLPPAIRFASPRPLQVITGVRARDKNDKEAAEELENSVLGPDSKIVPLITDDRGGIVLAQVGDAQTYVLSDPDLLSNRGMKSLGQAAGALALLDWLNSNEAEGIGFDVTTHGFARAPNPLKLAFQPPFLAMTIAIGVAVLLAGAHAFGRFGPAERRERALAFGKAALVDNSAALIRKAGREARMGGRYVAAIRERAVIAFGVPARLRDAALDAYLDRLGGRRRFSELAQAAEVADDRHTLVAAARALHDWQKEKIG